MLKADIHLHAGEDQLHKLSYSSKELIDHASRKGFEVLALTFHRDIFFNKELSDYAKKKGILLIPGVERYIEGKEVLIYNLKEGEEKNINTFNDLRSLKKKKDVLIIAPHPFFKTGNCLGKKLVENIDVFDAIEYSHFYTSNINFNKKAVKVARECDLAVVGMSDAHNLYQVGMTYSLIDSKKNVKSVFKAIREKKVILKTSPVPLKYFIKRVFKVVLDLE